MSFPLRLTDTMLVLREKRSALVRRSGKKRKCPSCARLNVRNRSDWNSYSFTYVLFCTFSLTACRAAGMSTAGSLYAGGAGGAFKYETSEKMLS